MWRRQCVNGQCIGVSVGEYYVINGRKDAWHVDGAMAMYEF